VGSHHCLGTPPAATLSDDGWRIPLNDLGVERPDRSALARLARVVMRHRRIVAGGWIALTIFRVFSAQQVSKRWLEQFSIPGFSAYEANQRTLHIFGSGAQPPNVAVLRVDGDITKSVAARETLARVSKEFPKYRTSSYFTTGSLTYVSR